MVIVLVVDELTPNNGIQTMRFKRFPKFRFDGLFLAHP